MGTNYYSDIKAQLVFSDTPIGLKSRTPDLNVLSSCGIPADTESRVII